MPALLTNTSMRLLNSSARAITLSMSACTVTSSLNAKASPPDWLILCATSSATDKLISLIRILYPCFAKSFAIPKPIPLTEPVTKAVFLSVIFYSISLFIF